MMTRRKVDNLLGLAVLSTVYQRPMHRYEMASIIRARAKDQQFGIKWGSLYTVVQNLEKHGFVEQIGSVKEGSRPERTIYRITPEGVAELLDWARQLLSEVAVEHPRFEAGLSVATALPPTEVRRLLRGRMEELQHILAAQRAALSDLAAELPRIFLIENEYSMAMLDAERAWIGSLLDELNDETFPGLTAWHAIHDSGEIPAELADLRERGAAPS